MLFNYSIKTRGAHINYIMCWEIPFEPEKDNTFGGKFSMIKNNIWNIFQKVRKENPLIQNITNFVVMPYTANILLAAGA